MTKLNIIHTPVSELKLATDNPRTHSKKQIGQIARSMSAFGNMWPVLVAPDGTVIAGNGRLLAARQLGMEHMPVIRVDHLTLDEIRAFRIADNRLAEKAGWDPEILKIEFDHLISLDPVFDVTVTGFEIPEIDLIVLGDTDKTAAEEDDSAALLQMDPVSRRGDLWQLGNHRIICGDALMREDYAALMDGRQADMVFTDPPYNVRIRDIVGTQHAEFSQASGEMTKAEFTAFLQAACDNMVAFSRDGSVHFICMDWRHMGELLAAGDAVYSELLNLCIWNKTNGGMGSLYRSKHEEVFVFKNGTAPHVNNVQLGKYGRYRTNIWDYAGQNTFHTDRAEELGSHPTVKPVQLVADAILDCSKPSCIVMDPFGGSGTTLLAAEKTGRQGRLIEYEPVYVDLTIRRWEALTGKEAVQAVTGVTFAETAQRTGGTP